MLTKNDLYITEFTSKDDTREVLQHIQVGIQDNLLAMVATDSYTLCEFSITINNPDGIKGSWLVNRKSFEQARKLANSNSVIEFTDDGNMMIDGLAMATLKCDREYPEYDKILKQEVTDNNTVNVQPDYLTRVGQYLKRVGQVSTEIKLGGALEPVMITSKSDDRDLNIRIAVMPLRK